jgi:nucleotide-binding universal stress UspA family protein
MPDTYVVACIDGIDHTARAICDLAAWASLGLESHLSLLHILDHAHYDRAVDMSGNLLPDGQRQLMKTLSDSDMAQNRRAASEGRNMLEAARTWAMAAGVPDPMTQQRHGQLMDNLLDLAPRTGLLVLGKRSEGSGREEHRIGEHLETVISQVRVPIIITGQKGRPPSRLMVAYDGSHTGEKMISNFSSSPLLKSLPCDILMVTDKQSEKRHQLKRVVAQLQSEGFDVSSHSVSGPVEKSILDGLHRTGADMLVMGAYGHNRFRRMILGSTTTRLLGLAPVPVMVLR